MKKTLTLFLSLFAFVVVAETNPKAVYLKAQQGKAVIIDVREADEVKAGIIEGAKWFPLSKIEKDPNWKKNFLNQTSGKEIYLYCRTGNRSGKVQKILKDQNIKSENLGGIETLKNDLPVKVPSSL